MHCFHLHSCCSSPHLCGPYPTCTSVAFRLGFPGLQKVSIGFTQQKTSDFFSNHPIIPPVMSLSEIPSRNFKMARMELPCAATKTVFPLFNAGAMVSSQNGITRAWVLCQQKHHEFRKATNSLRFFLSLFKLIMDLNTELHPLQSGISNVSVKVFSRISDNGVFEALSLRDVCLAESSIPQGNMPCYIGIHRKYTPTAQWYRCYVCKMLLSHFRSCQA